MNLFPDNMTVCSDEMLESAEGSDVMLLLAKFNSTIDPSFHKAITVSSHILLMIF